MATSKKTPKKHNSPEHQPSTKKEAQSPPAHVQETDKKRKGRKPPRKK